MDERLKLSEGRHTLHESAAQTPDLGYQNEGKRKKKFINTGFRNMSSLELKLSKGTVRRKTLLDSQQPPDQKAQEIPTKLSHSSHLTLKRQDFMPSTLPQVGYSILQWQRSLTSAGRRTRCRRFAQIWELLVSTVGF